MPRYRGDFDEISATARRINLISTRALMIHFGGERWPRDMGRHVDTTRRQARRAHDYQNKRTMRDVNARYSAGLAAFYIFRRFCMPPACD